MYRIIGADQREYGPVTADQVRDWINQRRANAQTKIKIDGTEEWKTLADFPEFAAALAGGTKPPPISPPPPSGASGATGTVTIDVDAVAKEILARNPSVQIGACFSRSWTLLTQNFWLTVGVCFVGQILQQVPLLLGVAQAGIFWFMLKRIRGEEAKFDDLFEPFSKAFLPTFLAGIVFAALVFAGVLCCLIPGMILGVIWTFTWPLLMDKRLDFWPAMELSRKVLWPNFWGMFGLLLLGMLVAVAGVLCCYVGIFVAIPVIIGAQAYAYEDFFGRKTAQAA